MSDIKDEEFAEALENQRSALYDKCMRYTGDPDDAEDIVQDVMVRAYEAREDFSGDVNSLSFLAWLYKMARSIFIDRCRREAARPEIVPVDDEETLGGMLPDKSLLQLFFLSVVIDCVTNDIPEDYSQPLRLFVLGDTQEEISEKMGISRNVVSTRISRARDKIREQLAEWLDEDLQ